MKVGDEVTHIYTGNQYKISRIFIENEVKYLNFDGCKDIKCLASAYKVIPPNPVKCITYGCGSYNGLGDFKGDLCRFCYDKITQGHFDKLPCIPKLRLETDGSKDGTKVYLDNKSIQFTITNLAISQDIYKPTSFVFNITVVGDTKNNPAP